MPHRPPSSTDLSGSELPGDAQDFAADLESLAEALGPVEPAPSGAARLRERVEHLPLRYAPFFSRLAELWDLDEAGVERELERAHRASAWSRTLVRGLRTFRVGGGPGRSDATLRLLRFQPGSKLPRHGHEGREEVLVLEGAYRDDSGRRFGAGDVQVVDGDVEHTLYIEPDAVCVAAVVERGVKLRGLLGFVARAFGYR